MIYFKNNEWEGKDAKWGKRLATAAIFNSFLSETSVFKMGGKNDKLFLKTLFQKNKVPNGKGVWHEHIYYSQESISLEILLFPLGSPNYID